MPNFLLVLDLCTFKSASLLAAIRILCEIRYVVAIVDSESLVCKLKIALRSSVTDFEIFRNGNKRIIPCLVKASLSFRYGGKTADRGRSNECEESGLHGDLSVAVWPQRD